MVSTFKKMKIQYKNIDALIDDTSPIGVVLNHMSHITDDDVIECAKIWTNNVYEGYTIETIKYTYPQGNVLDGRPRCKRVTCIASPKNTSWLNRFFEIGISPLDEPHFVSAGNIERTGELTYLPGVVYNQKILEITDFLRSKGYALPFRGLSTHDIEVLGWIKFKKKIKY